ncbi:MAG: hypothetical protein QG670_1425 [Thermoproteota archaeon]|nr:hypothetical protein [Thermoproteota archaeon]
METQETIVTKRSLSLNVALMAMCAGLYAIGSFITSTIPSPWGAGQFRPAVIIPALFAVIAGPFPAGVGAALGTLIADSAKYGRIYEGSLLAAVPGNFIGFYLFGLITKKFTWGRFVLASNVTLTLANLIVATLYVTLFKIFYLAEPKYLAFSSEAMVAYILGLTIWWFVTMLPFVLIVTPILVRAVSMAFPSLVPEDVRINSLKNELPQRTFSLALLVPGIIMVLIGLIITLTPVGSQMIAFFKEPTTILVQGMFYISGVVLTALGLLMRTRRIMKFTKS